jgi:hypothetical protein
VQRQQKINGLPVFVPRAIERGPLPFTLHRGSSGAGESHPHGRVAGRCYHHPALSERSVRLSPHCAQALQTFREECGFTTGNLCRCTC